MSSRREQSARGLAKAGAKRRPTLEARIAKARALGERWKRSERLMVELGATIGIPPQALVALFAGVVDLGFKTFVAIDIDGRIARFVTIVLLAHQV